jgi:hypothetical protein
MAKKKAAKEIVAMAAADVAESPVEQVADATANTDTAQTDTKIMNFQKVSTHKNGLTSYSIVGLRGSIYVGKGVFGKDVEPPDTIEVASPLLVEPTADQIERANKRAERKTRVKTSLAERIEKARVKAEKAAVRFAKLQLKAAKETPAETATEAPAATDAAFAGAAQ